MGRFFGLIVEKASLYIGHLGWLSSVPKQPKSKLSRKKSEELSRQEIYKDSVYTNFEYPDDCIFLIEAALDCGLVSSQGFGSAPITWQEIRSWMECVGEDSYWLAKTIRRFSEIYVREVREGSDPGRPSPIDDLIGVDEKRQSVKRQFKNFLKAKAR